MLRSIKVSELKVNKHIFNAVKKRQSELAKRCKEENAQYQDYVEQLEEQQRKDAQSFFEKFNFVTMVVLTGATCLGAALSREAAKRYL